MNFNILDKAVSIVVDFFEAERITESSDTIYHRAAEWMEKSNLTDPYEIAAATISGNYRYGLIHADFEEMKDFFFPSDPETLYYSRR